ncbi:MAG TPA: CheB methylesterase domain-containing protein [Polyangia bacterium]|nr:CheB methylesterase domain-containing protein [Polyangia bacterium]
MKLRVSICTTSGFLALVLRRTLAGSPHVEPSIDHRTAADALAVLRAPEGLAIIDVELLVDEQDGGALRDALTSRAVPSIVVDARGRGVPADVAAAPAVVVVRGRRSGELDLETIEAELLAAVGSARRLRFGKSGELQVAEARAAMPAERAEPTEAPLELIVIGVSTGGPTLLLRLFEDVAEPAIPLLVVQHMPASETPGFAARLGEHTGLAVREVTAGPVPPAGVIGVLRGGGDLRLVRRAGALHLRHATLEGNPFHPNVDEVLASAVEAGVALGAVILTGMGQDGAAGALAMARKGLPVIAQRPDTCAVGGMPQAVIDNGAARWVKSPEAIAAALNAWSDLARRAAPAGGSRCLA